MDPEGRHSAARRWASVLPLAMLVMVSGCSEFVEESASPSGIDTDLAIADSADSGGGEDAISPPEVGTDNGLPPGFGTPCQNNTDCDSGYCVPGPDGNVCTRSCVEDCPAGFSCKSVNTQGDIEFVCVYDHVPYCRPCQSDSDCAHPQFSGQGSICLEVGDGSGAFCATPCEDSPCPDNAVCETVASGDGNQRVCRPVSVATCTCSAWAIEEQATTSCEVSNALGSCQGQRSCLATGLTPCDAPEPVAELCNAADDDCDGETDEDFPTKGDSCDGEDDDACADGTLICGEDGSLMCDDDQSSTAELCNDVDDDCDGETDEDFVDKGTACDGNDLDLCADGVFQCSPTGLICTDDPASNAELCNDLDDDCNGETDEAFPDKGTACDGPDDDACAFGTWTCGDDGELTCSGDTAEANFADLDGTEGLAPGDSCGVGSCAGGTVICNEGTSVTCSSWDQVSAEVCDGIDNDCDGLTDEDFAPGGEISLDNGAGNPLGLGELCGTGACAGGEVVCTADGQGLECSTATNASNDICDGVDNDCDGSIDEDYKADGTFKFTDLDGTSGLVLGNTCGVGACAGGTVQCGADNASLVCSSSGNATDDVCDGVDNDCDGAIDEAYKAGGSFTYSGADGATGLVLGDACGTGQCAGGSVVCGANAVSLTCSTAGESSDDGCDNLDNDCDGVTDNAYVDGSVTYDDPGGVAGLSKGAPCGTGACDGGVVICAQGGQTLTCTNAPGGGELCDGVDNDCNGQTDEGCDDDGDGFCDANLSYIAPPGGEPLAVCPNGAGDCDDELIAVAPGQPEVCDGIDQNCVGGVDEGCDDDGDDYCDANFAVIGVPAVCPLGGNDCDDSKLAINPGAEEICDGADNNCDEAVDEGCDDDGDDYCDVGIVVIGTPDVCPNGGGDCDDSEPSAYPGATEICDDIDNNCFGGVDENCDTDGDDFCNSTLTVVGNPAVCPNGGGDCNDVNVGVNPSAVEICDGLDNNCGGGTDEGCDDDGDNYCDANIQLTVSPACPLGGGDCDDGDPAVNPSALEMCDNIDNNCSEAADEGCDDDGDNFCDANLVVVGFPTICPDGGGDCDDDEPLVRPGIAEICDDVDNNCADGVDEGCDDDNDNYCDVTLLVVGTPTTCTAGGGDCADDNPAVRPDADEVCDNVDNNCNTLSDEGCDDDGDDYCDASFVVIGTPEVCPNGGGDCADTNDAIKPSAQEICDDIDNNCADGIDEACDDDGDNYCVVGAIVSGTPQACSNGTGDCNDADPTINPGAVETCDDADNNCLNGIDEGCDDDGDNYCDAALTTVGTPSVCIFGGGDCDDAIPTINPGENELCDDIDNNCNSATDEPFTDGTVTYDGDPSGSPLGKGDSCGVGACAGGVVICGADKASLECSSSGAGEICDGVDNDCNGITDDGCDDDGDDYCDSSKTVIGSPDVCPNGGGDCADNDPNINPGVIEQCDDTDNNCAGGIDEGCDDDGDDYCDANLVTLGTPSACPNGGGDCDDANEDITPTAPEICDGLDNNCISGADEGCDDDGDDYCDATMTTIGAPPVCPLGPGDCDDSAPEVNPGETEICDDVDNDCGDGVDEGCDDDNDDYCDATKILAAGGASTCSLGGGDCNDEVPSTNPGAAELCDNLDNNCVGGSDEGCDDDDDNYCDETMTIVGTPTTCTAGGGDCEDSNPQIYPNRAELCNGLDDNCSGTIDEALTAPLNTNQNGLCQGTVKTCNGLDGWVDDYSSVPTYGSDEDPDGAFVDENCDGVDGDITRAVFVSSSSPVGDDDKCGLSSKTPCASITRGLARAIGVGRPHVYVQAGTYNESLELVDGVHIYGGFDGSWVRDDRNSPGHAVNISGGYNTAAEQYITLRAQSISTTIMDLFVTAAHATGRLNSEQGKSSYGIHAFEGNLTVRRVTIVQGDGYTGAGGSDGTAASANTPPAGGDGGDAQQYYYSGSTGDCTQQPGGLPLLKFCDSYVTSGSSGGQGGQMHTTCSEFSGCINCNPTGGNDAIQGCANDVCSDVTFVGAGGAGGNGGAVCLGGEPGSPGATFDGFGGPGAGSAKGRLIGLYWYGADGNDGQLGLHGGGGGGGGGSGGCDSGFPDAFGAGGGAGGAGGCRAPASGSGGAGGGGSFGVFGYNSTLDITQCLFIRGDGGKGGKGGNGQSGQPGGKGGLGGAGAGPALPGGDGGVGGRGGHSGGGGGGAGGISVGIFRYSGVINIDAGTSNTFQDGIGGAGGESGASPGAAGSNGAAGGEAKNLGTCAGQSKC